MNRPKLYPNHRHRWTDAELEEFTTGMVRCTICGFQAPRNAAGLDGDMTGARARVAAFPQIENGIAFTAAELDAALTADEDTQPEQENP